MCGLSVGSLPTCGETYVAFPTIPSDMECWYLLWSIVEWSPPYLDLGQWDNGNIGIITLQLNLVLVITLYLL